MNGIEKLPNGQWIVAGDTHLGLWAKEHKSIVTDPHLFKFLKPHLEDVRVVWDIGANIGDHTRQYLDWGKTVVAVEPNPLAFKCLEHNCPEATCLNIAASDSKGTLRFAPLANVGASRVASDGEIIVFADKMDDINIPAPDFVKIDVEGWEADALTGMMWSLKVSHPTVYVEINRSALALNNKTPEDVMMILKNLGYTEFTPYPLNIRWEDPQFDILAKP